MNKKKVLVPLDGSDFSQQILSQIPLWFHPEEAEMILFYVADEPREGTGGYAAIMHDNMENSLLSGRYGAQALEHAKHPIYTTQIEASITANVKTDLLPDRTRLENDGFSASTEVAFGDPAEQIIDYVKRNRIDLIAMTTHGRTGVRRLLMGSVAEKVLTHVTKPVLLLRPFEPKGMAVEL